jgi:phytoene/squalene synthetase
MEHRSSQSPAPAITKAASRQTYYTIRFLVDRDRAPDAYRAYAYFRWVDDRLDGANISESSRKAFLARQRSIMDRCYRADPPRDISIEERMLVDLIQTDPDTRSGLFTYLSSMMAVMAFDANRRHRPIAQDELSSYSKLLAAAVTEALHYFIGRGCAAPRNEARYLAVTGAHITHMLRDTLEDIQAGYFNIPREYLEAHGVDASEVSSEAYRSWVQSRVGLARDCFTTGRKYLARVANPRCRLAGYAYIARFEGVLNAIERDNFQLQAQYHETNNFAAALKAGWAELIRILCPFKPRLDAGFVESRVKFEPVPGRKP